MNDDRINTRVYTTKNRNEQFDWSEYFGNSIREQVHIAELDDKSILVDIRNELKEDSQRLSLILGSILRKLLKNSELDPELSILELGAGTGFLTRLLLMLYGGEGILVDNCKESYEAFKKVKRDENISYIVENVFEFKIERRFDFVCSFGLIEHYADKNEILYVHKKYLNENGRAIIIVPLDTILTRVYYMAHPELNLGYRELLTVRAALRQIKKGGLEPLQYEFSHGYIYDFLTVLCK